MNAIPNRKSWTKKLLVEGKDDLHVVANIRDSCHLPDNFEIVDCESVSNVKPRLASYLKTNIEVIGIIVDADSDAENVSDSLKARWHSLRDTLRSEGYSVPSEPNPEGTIIPRFDRKPRVGIWLMPDNLQYPGMLEDFVTTLIPPSDLIRPIAEQAISQVEQLRSTGQVNTFKPVHRQKALIHTWLAWQDEPGKPMGIAIKAKVLDPSTVLCQRFTAWLFNLFN